MKETTDLKAYRALRKSPRALVIFCSQISPEAWLAEDLQLDYLDLKPICIQGGPAALAHHKKAMTDWACMRRSISFLLNRFPTISTVIAITHEGCGYYQDMLGISGQERTDLTVIGQVLEKLAHGKKIRVFHARPIKPNSEMLTFEEINIS